MKKLIILLLVFIASSSIVFAQQQNGLQKSATGTIDSGKNQQGQSSGQGEQIQTKQQTQNQGEEKNLMVQEEQQTNLNVTEKLQQKIQQKNQEMVQEMKELKPIQQKIYQNQNEVRLAVHSLIEMKDLIGGIGSQVSQIAQEFNNSVQKTIKAEELIQTRNHFVRFFSGGDKNAAAIIEQETNQNKERIQQLTQLMEQCECGEETKIILQEQIMNMEQEQNRLQELAQLEGKSKGLFNWLFGWLRK